MKGYTSIEQSKKLLELGLDPDTADMYYNYVGDVIVGDYQQALSGARSIAKAWHKDPEAIIKKIIPAWSLAALLELMPNVIKRCGNAMFLTLEKAGAYNIYYKSSSRLNEIWFTEEELIDAAFKMVCWLIGNKYIRTTNKE